jgi:cysteine desulfurase
MRPLRDALLEPLLRIPGLELTGVDPRQGAADARLPHHISLLARDSQGTPLSGRRLVQQLWREGFAASSGSACSSGQQRPSPVLLAMGYSPTEAQAGLRLSLGPWHGNALLDQLPSALERALQRSGF